MAEVSSELVQLTKLPRGFQFVPSDEQLVFYYLPRRTLDIPVDAKDLYRMPPSLGPQGAVERSLGGSGTNSKLSIAHL
ncbi:NAC domain containing protein [Parasponia andersonii]|uniref:NAC domain containing protein n=1 Tax=Parasponia andersonii TaxID=3476 RepID=A0A2P5D6I9_PARAD|nr:NAC domain containing protein [Parasponia andersonii]